MNNTINSISFQANVKDSTKLLNPEKMKKVAELVKKGTKDIPNETLYITKAPNDVFSLHISNEKSGDFYVGAEIFIEGLDKQLQNASEKDFAKKLINAIKAFKLQKVNTSKIVDLKSNIETTKGQYVANTAKANAWRADNKPQFAKQYEVLALRNKEKFENLTKELNGRVESYYKKMDNLSKEFPEIQNIVW